MLRCVNQTYKLDFLFIYFVTFLLNSSVQDTRTKVPHSTTIDGILLSSDNLLYNTINEMLLTIILIGDDTFQHQWFPCSLQLY